MKKYPVLLALITLLALAISQCAEAAVLTWSRYNLNFEVPDNGFPIMNTTTRFEMRWDEMLLTVQLYDKSGGSDKKVLRNNLQSKALSYNMYELKFGSMRVKGFKCHTIDGVLPDGTRAIIADLVSSKSNIIIEVSINYLLGNRETAEDIIKSFAENSTREPAQREKPKQKVQKKSDADKQEQERIKKQEEQEKKKREKQRQIFEV